MTKRTLSLCLAAAFAAAPVHAAPTVEVLHWWTSGGEAAGMRVIKEAFEKAGGTWIDVPLAGGGGAAAKQVLKARFMAGNPPDAALTQAGTSIWLWAKEGALTDLDSVAKADQWEKKLPRFLSERLKYQGEFVAAPVNIQRLNALFVNPNVLKKAGVAITPGWPRSWDEFNAAADKIQKAGLVPLAHGGQPWQDQMLFSAAVLGVGGPDFYKKTMLDRDPAALTGPTMVKVFDQMRRLKGYTDKGSPGRDWNMAAAMLIRGEAGMQIMGDWVHGEFTASGKKPGVDYLCLPTPGSAGAFLSSTDVFVMFKVSGKEHLEGQKLLGRILMDADVQKRFNTAHGSIPARLDISKDSFDACGRRAMTDLAQADARGIAMAGAGAGAADDGFSGEFNDIVVSHFNSDMTSAEAVRRVAEALETAAQAK